MDHSPRQNPNNQIATARRRSFEEGDVVFRQRIVISDASGVLRIIRTIPEDAPTLVPNQTKQIFTPPPVPMENRKGLSWIVDKPAFFRFSFPWHQIDMSIETTLAPPQKRSLSERASHKNDREAGNEFSAAFVSEKRRRRPERLPAGRIPSLDGLRALAILGVIASKVVYVEGFPITDTLKIARIFGSLGVDLFLVISGYLITTLLLQERERTGGVNLGRFYLRRSLRILPAYGALLVALAILQSMGEIRITSAGWITALTWSANQFENPNWDVGHLWSLSLEEHFYLAWPLVFLWLSPRHAPRFLCGVMLVQWAFRCVILFAFPAYSELATYWTLTRSEPIAAGCLLAYAAKNPVWSRRLDGFCRQRAFWPVLLTTLLATMAMIHVSTKLRLGFAFSTGSLALSLLLWQSVRFADLRWGRLLNAAPMVWMGTLSYSLYLWHRLFIRPVPLTLDWAPFPVQLLELACVAVVAHFVVEKPFLRLKERFSGTMPFVKTESVA